MTVTVPTVTGWSNFWGESANAYAMLFSRSSQERNASLALHKSGFRAYRRLMLTLNGTAVGSTATDTYARVTAPVGLTETALFGGLRTIETVTSVSRATVTADKTMIDTRIINGLFSQAPTIPGGYPSDLSGNGGGGKAGV